MGNSNFRIVAYRDHDNERLFILYYDTRMEADIAKQVILKGYHAAWIHVTCEECIDNEWKEIAV